MSSGSWSRGGGDSVAIGERSAVVLVMEGLFGSPGRWGGRGWFWLWGGCSLLGGGRRVGGSEGRTVGAAARRRGGEPWCGGPLAEACLCQRTSRRSAAFAGQDR